MKTTTNYALFCSLLLTTIPTTAHAADQFVQVTNPGWTNSSQYSWTGAWGDYDKDGFVDLFVPNSHGELGCVGPTSSTTTTATAPSPASPLTRSAPSPATRTLPVVAIGAT